MSRPGDVDDPTKEYPGYVPPDHDGSPPTAPAPVVAGRNGIFRGLLWAGGVVALIVALLVGARAFNILPGFDNPFGDRTTDRSQPVLLQSMRDLSRFVAADGTFQVIVDLQENKENIPEFLVNKRTLFVGAGSVEAYVDFGTLSEGAVKPNADNTAVEIVLPEPQLGTAALDMERSYVVAEQRGLLNRIGDAFQSSPDQQQRVYQMAQQRITEAARASGLADRARVNTEKMLEGLLRTLGYTSVTVTYAAP
jgi:hypothetical protein